MTSTVRFLVFGSILGISIISLVVAIYIKIHNTVKCKNNTEETNNEGEWNHLDFKIYSEVFYILGTMMVSVISFASLFRSNISLTMQMVFFVLLTVPFYLIGYLISRGYIDLGKDQIKYRDCIGSEKTLAYSDISKAVINKAGSLEIYKDDKKVFEYPRELSTLIIKETLEKHGVKVEDQTTDN